MKKTLLLLIVCLTSTLSSDVFIEGLSLSSKDFAPFRSPTERQIEKESLASIKNSLRWNANNVDRYWEFWNRMVTQEERGFFGYHAAKQKVRIFHDIIKMIFEEIIEIESNKDFYYFRIPLNPDLKEFSTSGEYLNSYRNLDDAQPELRDQVISLNYTLFSNHYAPPQCSVCYFSNNQSWFNISYENKLVFLFQELGIPEEYISHLFQDNERIEHFESGVIYQFFDTSHYLPNHRNAYELLDRFCYPATAGGLFDTQFSAELSDFFQCIFPFSFNRNQAQLRLIMNTASPLNPYSTVVIRRYDLIDPAIVKKYEENLRNKIRNLPHDARKVDLYKKKLKEVWGV